jgi:hypothetical protein
MKTNRILITLLGAGFLAAGCSTTVVTNPGTPQTPASAPPVSGRIVSDTMAAEASVAAVQHLNVQVNASGSGLADAVRQAVEGQLADAGYKVAGETPDLVVNLVVSSSEFDRAGGYVRYEGSVDAGVTCAWEQKRLGFEPLTIRGKRGLGEDEAIHNLSAQLADATTQFVLRTARPELARLAVQDVIIKRPLGSGHDAGFPASFISQLRGQPGVVYCAMVAEDYDNRVMTFRVVYHADAVPEGLLNRVVAIPGLNIKPSN